MASIFEQTIVPKLNFSNFALNESQLLTCNFGQLVPCYIREVLPNDVFSLSAFADIQFAPMIAPMMQDVHASLHFFYVPNRIIWDDFETFITGAQDGHVISEENIPAQPGLSVADLYEIKENDPNSITVQGSIWDYFGLPNTIYDQPSEANEGFVISDIPLRGYFKIWYDYYRDENLQYDFPDADGVRIEYFDFWREWRSKSNFYQDATDGTQLPYALNHFSPFYRAYRKDYFTAALPSPQKGEPVTISLGTTAPVTLDSGATTSIHIGKSTPSIGIALKSAMELGWAQGTTELGVYAATPNQEAGEMVETAGDNIITDMLGTLRTPLKGVADISQASAITVEALREAFAVQEILESLSMRGSRFTEFLKGNFGVTPDDYRLQRPQFLGGVVTPVQVQQVLQQAGVDGDAGQLTGYAAGRAFAAAGSRVFRTRFKEHGYIIGIMSVMPKAYYYQGIPRHFMRKDRFDYYMPQTAHLGEQGIMNMELFYDADGNKNEAVFGYIPRWAEYKTSTNGIHGDFRGSLNYYHMARVFSQLPTLSSQFISTGSVQTRPWATWETQRPTVNHLIWANLFFKVTASRPMPYQSIPKIL